MDPAEHAIVYILGQTPSLVPGENGLEKEPIEVIPAHSDVHLAPASRINFGIQHAVQHTVKSKILGTVANASLLKLVRYWKQERERVENKGPQLKQ